MGNLKTITENQLVEIDDLKAKQETKALTVKQEEKLESLEKKLKASNSKRVSDILPETCKTYVKGWLKGKIYNKRKDITNKYLRKGIQKEDTAINMLMEHYNLPWNCKNVERRYNEHMEGECDLYYPNIIYDTKCSFDCFTFPLFDKKLTERHDYYYQGQVYMDLWNVKKYAVAYVLTNTPHDIVDQEIRRRTYGMTNESQIECLAKEIVEYHNYDGIEMSKRIKLEEFDYDSSVIQRIVARVELIRKYITELTGVSA